MSRNNIEEFEKVLYKRKGKGKRRTAEKVFKVVPNNVVTDQTENIRKITQAKQDLRSSQFFASIILLIRKCLDFRKTSKIDKIVCFGLGIVSEQRCSRHQLALLLCFKDLFQADINASDPQFSQNDKIILKHFGVEVEDKNIEAKYPVNESLVLLYLPHCPKELSNNLLWTNWTSKNLANCIIISNSFKQIIENTDLKDTNSIGYIKQIMPFCLELDIDNSFKYFEVFCDTSVHYFPLEKLKLVSDNFWMDNSEPVYVNDSEYIGLIKTKT